jgi:hypothetical protein
VRFEAVTGEFSGDFLSAEIIERQGLKNSAGTELKTYREVRMTLGPPATLSMVRHQRTGRAQQLLDRIDDETLDFCRT